MSLRTKAIPTVFDLNPNRKQTPRPKLKHKVPDKLLTTPDERISDEPLTLFESPKSGKLT